MTLEEQIMKLQTYKMFEGEDTVYIERDEVLKLLEQEPCEMTAEEYRQRMMQAFHNADCDELIAICVLPTENEFEHLEWLLKSHYKKEPCEDAISREDALMALTGEWTELTDEMIHHFIKRIKKLPPVTPQPKTDTLDKIRAEIEEIEKNYGFDKATKYGNKNAEQQNLSYGTMHFYEIADIFDDIKDIIDKYKAESEE